MKMRADIATLEDKRDKILSVCQMGSEGDIEHEIIILRGPKEFDFIDDQPGPRISCEDLGLDLEPGPEAVTFSGDCMKIVIAGHENIEVDISRLSPEERKDLVKVAEALFQ